MLTAFKQRLAQTKLGQRWLVPVWRRVRRRDRVASPVNVSADAYAQRVAAEAKTFDDCVNVHDLPAISHYWSDKYLSPKIKPFGFASALELFEQQLLRAGRTARDMPRFVSIGAGNCDTEVEVAAGLIRAGLTEFTLECFDLSEPMLERGRALAAERGVARQVKPTRCDLNTWRPNARYDAVIANQSLHHIVALEHVFDAIDDCLEPHGVFVTSDIIGRNGHQRWPEARTIVQEFWRELPEGYRYQVQLRRHEPEFLDWDCSIEGFEGIRAQDVLPLLEERFDFEIFVAWGNVIDVFIDRGFGHHFDVNAQWDRDFIDRVHARDEAEIAAGRIKPTHLLAAMRKRGLGKGLRCLPGLTPEFCIRRVD